MSVSGAASASFLYDGDGVRVRGTVNGVTSYYVGTHYEVAGGVVKKYYYAGTTRIAMRENGALRWLLSDHLGSTAYTVNGTAETGEVRYKAFGATRFTSGTTPTSYRYTGQREEAGLGLYYYGARWYDPALGHFIQPDTIIPQPGNVLDYHRYSYVRFNPLKYTDPSGHCVATAASVAGALVSGGGSLALSPSSLAFDAACWAAVVAAIQVSNHLADNPPAFPELQLPGGNESYPLTVAEPQIYAQPVGSDLEVGVTIQGTSVDSTLQIGNVTADPLPGLKSPGHVYLSTREREIVSLQRSIRSLENNIAEHEKKIEEYLRDPDAHDNQGHLRRNARSEAIRQNIIQGRVRHLQGEIRTWQNKIQELQRQLDELSKQ